MAYPYVPYTINTPYLWPYYHQPVTTPFIPSNVPLPSPNAGAGTRQVHFDVDEDDVYRTGRRPPSWHAGMSSVPPPNPAPFPSPPFVYTPLPGVVPLTYGTSTPYRHNRRLSDTALPQPTWVYPAWMVYPQAPPPPPATFNPLINGELPEGPLLLFDLSSNIFEPRRLIRHNSPQTSLLTQEELTQTATYPSVTRMVISCDEIPQWNVVLEPQTRSTHNNYLAVPGHGTQGEGATAPITVYDVLFSIHRMLQRQVTHREWYDVPQPETVAIGRAYTRRCRAVPKTQAFEESQGVRRVDYLKDKYTFKGLVRERGREGFEHVRLRVGKK